MGRIYALISIYLGCVALFFVLASTGGSAAPGGKVLRLALDTEPLSLDPIDITDTLSDGVARKVFNGLVRLKKVGDELIPGPELADYEVSPDGRRYTFTLHPGIHFHNGREVVADDVVYSFKRLLRPPSKRPQWLEPMVKGSREFARDGENSAVPLGIVARDKYTVTVELVESFAPFIQLICTSNCAIVPREAVEDRAKPFARNPVGTGPFRLTEWRDNQLLVLRRNDDYFKGRPKLDGVQFSIVKDATTRLEQFFAGELDAAGDLPPGRVVEALGRAGAENSFAYDTLRTNYLGIGMPNGQFKNKADLYPFGANKRLRQALNYAIDRQYLCTTVLEGRATPARGVLPPGMPAYDPARPGWPHDPGKARALLAEAGYPEGRGLPTLTLLHRNDETSRKLAQAIAYDLSTVGITVEPQAREWKKFLEMVENEPQAMFLLGWVADYSDPDNFLYVLFNSNQIGPQGNHTWYSNPQVDELTRRARTTVKLSDRVPLYRQAEDIVLDDASWICTYYVRNVILLRKEVTGLRENTTPLDTGTEFPQVDFVNVDIDQ